MQSIPFCVHEKPYMIWADDVDGNNQQFLKNIDADLYYRMAHTIIKSSSEDDVDQDRRDVSTLSRLLWHHGMETLVMLIGAYIQAPSAVYAYFLKCKTEDAIQMGQLLLQDRCPKYHRSEGAPFSLLSLMAGIHHRAGWSDRNLAIDRFARALRNMLQDYVNDHHRWEYNSIKHGLRTSHGRFALAVGIQEAPNIPAPEESMQVIGASRDASFFSVVRPLTNATKQQSKINFTADRVSLSWSLEKVLMELQLLSFLIHNTASALQITLGAESGKVTFNKGADDQEFWELYTKLGEYGVRNASFGDVIDAREVDLATEKSIFNSYKRVNPSP